MNSSENHETVVDVPDLNKMIFDWLIALKPLSVELPDQPSYALTELTMLILALVTFLHSLYMSGRWFFTWLASLVHGLVVSVLFATVAQLETHWHAQSVLMLLDRKLPLHVLLMYPICHYTTHYCVAHLRVPRYAQAMTAGLLEMLLTAPCQIISVKYLHRTWHNTEPLLEQRLALVPCICFLFQLFFGVSFFFSVQLWRRVLTPDDAVSQYYGKRHESLAAILGGATAPLFTSMLYCVVFLPLDLMQIGSSCTVTIAVGYCLLKVWCCDRKPTVGSRKQPEERSSQLTICCVIFTFCSLFLLIPLLFSPENEKSRGFHQKIGPCDVFEDSIVLSGSSTARRKYMCIEDYDISLYNLTCSPANEPTMTHGTQWYTMCGVSHSNRANFVAVVFFLVFLIMKVFNQLVHNSAPSFAPYRKKVKSY